MLFFSINLQTVLNFYWCLLFLCFVQADILVMLIALIFMETRQHVLIFPLA